MKLNGNIAVITGGAGLIGRAIALRFAREGAKVVIIDIDDERINSVVCEIKANGGCASGKSLDITDNANVEVAIDDIINEYGRIDLLVTSAGGSSRGRRDYFYRQKMNVITDNINLNLFGALYFAHAVSKYMVEQKSGKMIFITSIIGSMGGIMQAEYSAAKGGVIGMSKSLSKELGRYGITVNCVSPGIVPRDEKDYSETNYLGRNCSAEDISNMVTYLASDEANFCTGHDFVVDGGRSIATKGSY